MSLLAYVPAPAPLYHPYAQALNTLRETSLSLFDTVVRRGINPDFDPITETEVNIVTAFTCLKRVANMLLAQTANYDDVMDILVELLGGTSYQYYGNQYVKGGQVLHSLSYDIAELCTQVSLITALRALAGVNLVGPSTDSDIPVEPTVKLSTAAYFGSTLVNFDTEHVNPALTNIMEVPLAPRTLIAGDLADEKVLTSTGHYVAQIKEFIAKAISLTNNIFFTKGAMLNQRHIHHFDTDSLNNLEKLLTLLAVSKKVGEIYKPGQGNQTDGFPYRFDFEFA
jgi:hypothetical protein